MPARTTTRWATAWPTCCWAGCWARASAAWRGVRSAARARAPPGAGLGEDARLGAMVTALDDLIEDRPVSVGGAIEAELARSRPTPAAGALDEGADGEAAPRRPRPGRRVAVTTRGTEIPVRYAIVELGDLVTSHTDDLERNAAFPAELQPGAASGPAPRRATTSSSRAEPQAADAGKRRRERRADRRRRRHGGERQRPDHRPAPQRRQATAKPTPSIGKNWRPRVSTWRLPGTGAGARAHRGDERRGAPSWPGK
jgi:hypothetical protein